MANQGGIQEADLTLDGFTQLAGLTTVVLVFIGLLGWDTLKALKKRAHWIPGDWLVLSALTIQILNLLNGESSLLKDILENTKNLNGEVVKNNLFMIHSSRVMLCVLVAYLYNLCMSIDCRSSTKFPELMNELNSVLADIIGSCIDKVEAALVDNCKKWAVDLQERKLLKAVYIASKSRVLIEKLKSGPSVPIGPSTRDDAVIGN